MKRILIALSLVAALIGSAGTASAQATMTQTSLSAALNGTSTQTTVAVATGIVAGYGIYVDRELMLVNVVSGTTLTVQRGYGGTAASSHITGSITFAGPLNYFYNAQPSGSCTATQQVVLPRVNTPTGTLSNCVNGRWQGTNLNPFAMNTWPRTPVANEAYTVKVTDVIIAYTTLTAGRTVTLPSAVGMAGRVLIVKDEAGIATTYNITMSGTIDGGTSAISTNYGTLRLYSTGSAWTVW